MNYQKHYDNLMKTRKEKCSFGNLEYWEKHHIVPKCLGGSDENFNLVHLTAREHYIAHWLLIKIYSHNYLLKYAFNMLQTSKDKRRLNGKQLERIKNFKFNHSEETKQKMKKAALGKIMSDESKLKNSQKHSGKILTDDHKKKISESLSNMSDEEKLNWSNKLKEAAKKRAPISEETRKKLSEQAKIREQKKKENGFIVSEETKRKISNATSGENNPFYGKHHTEETKQKLRRRKS